MAPVLGINADLVCTSSALICVRRSNVMGPNRYACVSKSDLCGPSLGALSLKIIINSICKWLCKISLVLDLLKCI